VFSNPQVEKDYRNNSKYIKHHLKAELGRRLTDRWRLSQVPVPSGKLLEIGCSIGLFLDEAREVGFDVVGLELNEEARGYAKEQLGLEVRGEDLYHTEFKDRFDVVAMFNVLEHVPCPSEFLTFIRENLLAENGIIVIEVPNIFTVQGSLARNKHAHFQYAHYSYYSKKTFELLAEKSGLKVDSFAYGRRIYPLGQSASVFLRRYQKLSRWVQGGLQGLGLEDRVVEIGFREFLFFVCRNNT